MINNVRFNRQWFQCVIKTRMFDSDNYCFALIIVNVNEAPRSKSLSTLIQINRRKHDYYGNKFQLTKFVSCNAVAWNTVNEISSYHLWPVVHRLKFDQIERGLFFFWFDNLQRNTNTLPLRGKSERETSICPWKLFVTISCGPSLRRIPLRVKMPRKQTGHCFQNAPKIPFSWHALYKT